jgi:hypothetical protein
VEGRGVAVCRVESGDRGDKMGSGDWGVRWVTLAPPPGPGAGGGAVGDVGGGSQLPWCSLP